MPDRPHTTVAEDLRLSHEAIEQAVNLYLDRVPLDELDREQLAETVFECLSDELHRLYEIAARDDHGAAAAEVHVQPTRYEVSVLPADDINRPHFTLYVEYRGPDCWAVTNGFHDCLGADGTWSYEMVPSERAAEWLSRHRFDLATALALAKEHAPHIRVNGHSALDALRHANAGEPL